MKAYRSEFTPQDEKINILVSDAELPDTVYGGDTLNPYLPSYTSHQTVCLP
mgnify:FL=1